MQAACKGHSILARYERSIGKIGVELCTLPEIFQSNCKQQPTFSLGLELPLHSWTKIVTDISYFEGASYLLIVDYTSRFPIVCKLSSMTRQHIATYCKQVFSEYS